MLWAAQPKNRESVTDCGKQFDPFRTSWLLGPTSLLFEKYRRTFPREVKRETDQSPLSTAEINDQVDFLTTRPRLDGVIITIMIIIIIPVNRFELPE